MVEATAQPPSDAMTGGLPGPRGVIPFMAGNPVAANLVMLALVFGGLLMLGQVRQEVFPESAPEIVNVSVAYPGASPAEVEQGVLLAVEEALSGLEGIKRISATANEGVGSVRVELLAGSDRDVALQDVQAAVNRITSFPLDAERATVSLASRRRETVSLIFYGEVDELVLRRVADQARSDLLRDDRVTDVELSEVRPLEISVEVSEHNLRRYGLTLPQIASAISSASLELPGGAIDSPSGEVLVRMNERRNVGEEFSDIVIVASPDGTRVTVGEIGTVIDGFRDIDQRATFNGLPASRVRVFRAGDQTPIELSEAIYDYLDAHEGRLPPGVNAVVWFDRSEMFRDRINLLLRNGYLGLGLVLIILALFLEVKLAFWVTLGIPISFLGSIILMPFLGVSINMVSLFAFILTLGIVVDDAIVVGEAVYHRRSQGMKGLEAAIAGARDVAAPVVFSVLTTMIAFIPLLYLPSGLGRFVKVIPLVVVAVFAISLVESLLILPAHLAHSTERRAGGFLGLIQRAQRRFSAGLEWLIARVYAPSLLPFLRFRYLTFAVAASIFILSLGVLGAGHVKWTFMPRVESDVITATLRMPFGTPVEITERVAAKLVEDARGVLEANGGEAQISRGIYATIGTTGESLGPSGGGGSGGGHIASVSLYLVPLSEREISSTEFTAQWRNAVGDIPGAEMFTFRFSTGPSSGAPISVRLTHNDVPALEAAAARLADHLTSFAGVTDIDSGVSMGKQQLDLRLRPEARGVGLTQQDLARQVRGAFFGAEAVRQQRGRDEVRVYVRRPLAERTSEHFLDTMMIKTPDGGEIPLSAAATVSRGRAYTSITRVDGRRVVEVAADVEDGVAIPNEVMAAISANFLPALLEDTPGLSYDLAGEQEEQREAGQSIRKGFGGALLGMFALMAIAFRSYLQPIIIMSAIPFALVGAVLGHIVMGYAVSMMSVFGMVALSGVVVNDSLLLVTATNQLRAGGVPLVDAVVQGASRRFRPIMMTSLTTFFGLAPMMLETSVQARFLIPMAISLGFGILFVTFVTLGLVPVLYMIVEDMKSLVAQFGAWLFSETEDDPREPTDE